MNHAEQTNPSVSEQVPKGTILSEAELKIYNQELLNYYHHGGEWPDLTDDQLQQVRRYQGELFRQKWKHLD